METNYEPIFCSNCGKKIGEKKDLKGGEVRLKCRHCKEFTVVIADEVPKSFQEKLNLNKKDRFT